MGSDQQQESFVDSINKSVDSVQKSYSAGKQKLFSFGNKIGRQKLTEAGEEGVKLLAKTGRTASFATFGTILFLLIGTGFIIMSIGGSGGFGGNPTSGTSTDPNASPGPSSSPLPPADIAEIMKYVNVGYLPNSNSNGKCFAKTGSVCNSFAGLVLTDAEKNFVYSIFKNLLKSQKYKDLLGSTPVNLYFFKPIHPGFIDGGAGYNNNDMAFFGYFRNGVLDKYKRSITIHESGHILSKRNGNNQLGMNLLSLISADGSACYDYRHPRPYYLKTYAFRGREGGNGGAKSESFAEAVANNAICFSGYPCTSAVGHAVTLNDYPFACAATYAWIKNKVFGGVDVSQ